jgi:hypothetical protein
MNSIKTVIRTHAEWLLVGIGVSMVVAIVWFMAWGVARLAGDIGASLSPPQRAASGEQFNIEAASQLDFRGLQGQ